MRGQVTIDHVPLSSRMRVVFVENSIDGLTAEQFVIDSNDAEYQLLAQAIDRFVAVQRVNASRQEVDA